MRLWSVVTSQLDTFPRCQVGTVSALAAIRHPVLQVVGERRDLLARPARPDRGHRAAAVADEALERRGIGQRRGRRDVRAEPALAGEPVALGARALPGLLAER